ncbi:MAG TPA: SAF domain-containing protein [Acidimicrobiales bacterium]|nr:SAF domain-containing protein [Acidimicrobiales bacterium]
MGRGGLQLGARPVWWRAPRARTVQRVLGRASALLAVTSVLALAQRARQTMDAYGRARRVAVARHELPAGARVGPGDVVWRELPVGVVPASAFTDPPVGRVVVDPIGAGEVLSRLHLAPGGLSDLAARVPPGDRAVGVPVADRGVPLEVGDRVDVLAPATTDPDLSRASPAVVVAHHAEVLAVEHGLVVLAVSVDEAGEIAGALAQGTPVLALDGG